MGFRAALALRALLDRDLRALRERDDFFADFGFFVPEAFLALRRRLTERDLRAALRFRDADFELERVFLARFAERERERFAFFLEPLAFFFLVALADRERDRFLPFRLGLRDLEPLRDLLVDFLAFALLGDFDRFGLTDFTAVAADASSSVSMATAPSPADAEAGSVVLVVPPTSAVGRMGFGGERASVRGAAGSSPA